MSDEIRDQAEELASKAAESFADKKFSAFDLHEQDDETKEDARTILRVYLIATVAGIVIGLVEGGDDIVKSLHQGIACATYGIGLYSLFSGKAMLKPSISDYTVYYGSKARVIGLVILCLGIGFQLTH